MKGINVKIVYIAPLPPPINGHSLVSKAFYDALELDYDVKAINLSKKSFVEGVDSFGRIIEIIKILKDVWFNKKDASSIYLTISESLAGNLKDILIYLLCFNKLSKMYIHLHGGSIKKLLWDRHKALYFVNKFFIKRLGGIIISGESHLEIFSFVDRPKIHIVPNFAPDGMFVSEEHVKTKFLNLMPLRILYLSNFIEKKGYNELLEAYLTLDEIHKSQVTIDFAGRFESESQKQLFLQKLKGHSGIRYHGAVDDEMKRKLFAESHIFCLPTAFLEGQPISILEAYAAGCVVLTTGQSGILDIFTNEINGYQIQEKSPDSIKHTLEQILVTPQDMLPVALNNVRTAGRKHRISAYNSSLHNIIAVSKPNLKST
ncbi:MAG TPA: glycosyltransferase family 4 protein [Bacteroidales bacterium]